MLFVIAGAPGLTQALHHVGDTYTKIGQTFEEEPRHDWEPLGNLLYEYRGILDGFPQIITATKVFIIIYNDFILPLYPELCCFKKVFSKLFSKKLKVF